MKLRFLLLSLLSLPELLPAQNSDFGNHYGLTRRQRDIGPRRETQYNLGLQMNYAHQIRESAAGRLYLEIPYVSALSQSDGPGETHEAGDIVEIYRPGSAYYLTPGLRYHYNLTNRLYLYGAAGAGVAFRRQSISVLTRDPSLPGGLRSLGVASDWNASPGFNAGAGLGFRLSRFFSLRAEYRSFRSTAIRGFRDARETPGIYAGWAMHR